MKPQSSFNKEPGNVEPEFMLSTTLLSAFQPTGEMGFQQDPLRKDKIDYFHDIVIFSTFEKQSLPE